MRKTIILAVFAAAFLLIGVSSSFSQNAPAVTVSTNKKTFSPGESGVLILNFKTTSKVKIPKEPGITLDLSTSDIEGQGFQDYTGGEGDYINNSKVKYNFVVPSGAASGSTLNIKGTLKYGFCTTVDGVCKLTSKEISTTIRVK